MLPFGGFQQNTVTWAYFTFTVFPGPWDALFFPEKCGLNSTCVLCAEGKYYFETYKYPYIYYTSLSWDSESNHEDDFSRSDGDFLVFYDE